jgi:putative aldouronate transport system permease protein
MWVFSYVFIGIWKSVGWNTIIYLAAITGISPELYEAAAVDGAGRLRRIWHITLPGLRPTIVVLLILNLGSILGIEFERPFTLQNNLVYSTSNVLSIFVYQYGIREFRFSIATAVGFFQSIISLFFLFGTNAIAKRFGERGVW